MDCLLRFIGIIGCVVVVLLDVWVVGVRGNFVNVVVWVSCFIKKVLKLVFLVWREFSWMNENFMVVVDRVVGVVVELKVKGMDVVIWCDGVLFVIVLVSVLVFSLKVFVFIVGCMKVVLFKFNFSTFILNRKRKKLI